MADAHVSDLSITGAFIETKTELPLGSIILLRFEAEGERIKVEAEVVREDPPRGMGVRFLSLGAKPRAIIEQIGEQA
jgi:hypothetical protein